MTNSEDTGAWLGERMNEMLRALQLDVNVETETEEGVVRFNLTGPDYRHFLAHKAEPLKSMSFLLQTSYDKQYGEDKLIVKVDANHNLKNREDELSRMVREACLGLTEIGNEADLEPMNPYDRRQVHMILCESDEYATESDGVGHFKTVVIKKVK